MCVLLIGWNTAVDELAKALKRYGRGCEVRTFVFYDYGQGAYKNLNISSLHRLPKNKLESLINRLRMCWVMFKNIWKFDILHFNGESFVWFGLDLILWKLMGKKIIMHYHGTSLRDDWLRVRNYNFIVKLCVDKFVVSTPDLLKYCKEAEYIPNTLVVE